MWAMLYADDLVGVYMYVCVTGKPDEGDDDGDETVFEAAGLTMSEKKIEILQSPTPQQEPQTGAVSFRSCRRDVQTEEESSYLSG